MESRWWNKNISVKVLNIIFGYFLPIVLTIFILYRNIRYVHLTSQLRRTQHHITAREKYDRSLVIQFLLFYTVWIALWSPNVIVYQVIVGWDDLTNIVRLLNFIEIALDPIIIGALDVRFRLTWRKIWLHVKEKYLKLPKRQIRPIMNNPEI